MRESKWFHFHCEKKSAAASKLRNTSFKSPLDEINVFNWDLRLLLSQLDIEGINTTVKNSFIYFGYNAK